MKRLHSQKGFTLIELLIVIAILGILAAIAIPVVGNMVTNGKVAAANSELASVQTASTAYMAENNVYPSSSSQLTSAYIAGTIKLVGGYNINATSGLVSPSTIGSGSTVVYDGTTIHWDGTNYKFIR